MSRVYNFSPGPAALPEEVLRQAQEELLDWKGRGMSVMEISHRGQDFMAMADAAEADFRELLNIPASYRVLFLPGGAQIQFSMVPLNLLGDKHSADYIETGIWAKKAITEARRYTSVNVAASAEASGFTEIPTESGWKLEPAAAYVHITTNETIDGVQYPRIPEVGAVPLAADMSSDILSQPVDVSRFGLIYASAQKNIGPAGLTIVIVREDLLDRASPLTPHIFNYQFQAKNRSMANTPPTFTWYLAGLVFQWLKKQGGVAAIAEVNRRKAEKLYRAIDESALYVNTVKPAYRSRMNIPFRLRDPSRDAAFLAGALKTGLANLKGHALAGGMRASLYNAVPEAAVDALVAYMREFEGRMR